MRLLLVLACACGGRQAAHEPPHTRLDVLGGELSVEPPIASQIEPNQADSIMAAPPSASNETLVRMRDSSFHAIAVFRREWIPCASDPAAAARVLGDGLKLGTFDVTPVSATTFLVLPRAPEHRGDITSLGFIATCAGAAGLISAHLMVEGDRERGREVMTQLARTIAPGRSPSPSAARQVTVPACDQTMTLALPEGYIESVDAGADFEVHHFQRAGASGAFGVYIGSSPHSFAPADAATEDLAGGIHVQRWQDDGGVHLQRIEQRGACTIHAFGIVAPADEAELRALIAFALG